MNNQIKRDIEQRFARLCVEVGREGVIGFASAEGVRLLPEQHHRLQEKLSTLGAGSEGTAVSLGLLYHDAEILAVPSSWQPKAAEGDHWNEYAQAYLELNRTLDHVSSVLATELGGVAEKATIEGWAGKVQHVGDYFAHCISHRAFAEAAGLGWRGRHGLIVTPEAGPALRFATVFVPERILPEPKELAGCGECRACLDVCPILRKGQSAPRSRGDYREACRQRIHKLGLEADVCGICVRVCWEQVRPGTRPGQSDTSPASTGPATHLSMG
jgi:epoxyqueuosine reductase